jgi:MFS family permease
MAKVELDDKLLVKPVVLGALDQTKVLSNRYRFVMLFLLMLVYASSYADRTIIAVVQERIKHEFGLADWQLGFLGGTSFAVFYSLLGIPIARLADRYNRVNIIVVCMALWSAMTAFCGFAGSFAFLVAGRLGVGVGEAGCTPPSHSIISNYFPPEHRAWALSIYSAGMTLGAMTAALGGGWIAQAYGWRMTFLVLGVTGIVLVGIVKLVVREPLRVQSHQEAVPPLSRVVRQLLGSRTYTNVLAASIIGAFLNSAITLFTISFFLRSHRLVLVDATLLFAVAQGAFATIGVIGGGIVVNRLRSRIPDIEPLVCMASTIVCGISFALAYALSSLWPAIAALLTATLAQWFYVGPSFGMMQSVAPERGRATAMGVYLFSTSLLGGGLGPLVVGFASDVVAGRIERAHGLSPAACILAHSIQPAFCAIARANGLQIAIASACVLFFLAAFHFARARRSYLREIAH